MSHTLRESVLSATVGGWVAMGGRNTFGTTVAALDAGDVSVVPSLVGNVNVTDPRGISEGRVLSAYRELCVVLFEGTLLLVFDSELL
jgi:hypothetical protein